MAEWIELWLQAIGAAIAVVVVLALFAGIAIGAGLVGFSSYLGM